MNLFKTPVFASYDTILNGVTTRGRKITQKSPLYKLFCSCRPEFELKTYFLQNFYSNKAGAELFFVFADIFQNFNRILTALALLK